MESSREKTRSVLVGHTSPIIRVVITSDNKYIVSGSDNYTVRIWNLKEKRQEAVLEDSSDIFCVTTDNKFIVYSMRSTLGIWNLQEKRQEAILEGNNNPGYAESIAITNDSKYIVTNILGYLTMWNFKEKKKEAYLYANIFTYSVAITSDNKYIVSCSERYNLLIWNLQEKRLESRLDSNYDNLKRNPKELISYDKYIVCFDYKENGINVRIWNLHEKRVELYLKKCSLSSESFKNILKVDHFLF